MHIHTRIVDDVAVTELSGRFVSSDPILHDHLLSLAQEGHTRVVVDLAGVNYMDSSGLGELIAGYVAAKQAGGVLKLMRLTRRVEVLLAVTKLVTIFETFADEATAIASFTMSPVLARPELTTRAGLAASAGLHLAPAVPEIPRG
jgi:anti-sigma B factor antagonist